MARADQLKKNLPKRAATWHPKHEKRQGHKARARARKAARWAAQEARHERNVALVAAGQLTPWQVAKAKRASKR